MCITCRTRFFIAQLHHSPPFSNMKFNLPPRNPRADTAAPTPTLSGGLYRSTDEAVRRKQALIAQMEERRSIARAARPALRA